MWDQSWNGCGRHRSSFCRRGNRFWRVIHLSGFTPEEILPENDGTILRYRCGLTSVVDRLTVRADQLSAQEFVAVAAHFERKIARKLPRFVGFLGRAVYSVLSGQREIAWGSQPVALGGAVVWVLPNPSGRNRAFTLDQLVSAYCQLYLAHLINRARPPSYHYAFTTRMTPFGAASRTSRIQPMSEPAARPRSTDVQPAEGLAKTCAKLGVAFWDYLGSRPGVPGHPVVPALPQLVRCRGHPA